MHTDRLSILLSVVDSLPDPASHLPALEALAEALGLPDAASRDKTVERVARRALASGDHHRALSLTLQLLDAARSEGSEVWSLCADLVAAAPPAHDEEEREGGRGEGSDGAEGGAVAEAGEGAEAGVDMFVAGSAIFNSPSCARRALFHTSEPTHFGGHSEPALTARPSACTGTRRPSTPCGASLPRPSAEEQRRGPREEREPAARVEPRGCRCVRCARKS